MNKAKTPLQDGESRRWTVFIVKVIIFILLVIFGNQILRYSEEWGFFLANVLNAVGFFLGGYIVVSLVRIITVRLYLRKKSNDPMRSNFEIGRASCRESRW